MKPDWAVPTGFNNHVAYVGNVRGTAPTSLYGQNRKFTVYKTDLVIQTGHAM